MTEVTMGQLSAPGSNLYYELRGTGSTLLILQGGDGDAGATAGIEEHLAAHFTVLTYDRRGLSRSRPLDSTPITLGLHAEDAHHLLAAVTREPALVFGTSLGALLGLELLVRHPEQVRLLVAHEPPATQFLPGPQREAMSAAQLDVEQTLQQEGMLAAMKKFASIAGLDFADREPGVALPSPGPNRVANLSFFLAHDAPAVRLHRLDEARLKELAGQVVLAVGKTSAGRGPGRCAQALASFLGRPTVELAGGHNGFLTHPRAFAAGLLAVLSPSQAAG